MAGLRENTERLHKDCGKNRVKEDEASVQAVLETIRTRTNPFAAEDHVNLCNISSGVVVTDDIAADLLHAYAIGERHFIQFVNERMKLSNVNFYDPLPKLNLKTFSALLKSKSVKVKGASVDGSLAKSKLLELLEKNVSPAENVPSDAAWMIDAMVLLQGISTVPRTFADLAFKVFEVATASFLLGSVRIDFVVDRYPTISIKGCERSQRAKQGMVKIRIANRSQKCPTQWKKYLSVDCNKSDLSEFLVKEWVRPEYARKLHNRFFFVTHGTTCTLLTSTDGIAVTAAEVPDLECSHEEADTRLLLHATHAGMNGFTSVVIRSPDTDVAILAFALSPDIAARVFFRTGTKTRSRYVDIQAVRGHLGEGVCNAPLGLHALTGCDTTSAFKRRGKKAGLQILQSNPTFCGAIGRLGLTFHVPDDLFSFCEAFVCQLYGSKLKDINEFRYELFSVN